MLRHFNLKYVQNSKYNQSLPLGQKTMFCLGLFRLFDGCASQPFFCVCSNQKNKMANIYEPGMIWQTLLNKNLIEKKYRVWWLILDVSMVFGRCLDWLWFYLDTAKLCGQHNWNRRQPTEQIVIKILSIGLCVNYYWSDFYTSIPK